MINQIVKFNIDPEHSQRFKTALLEDKKMTEQTESGRQCVRYFLYIQNSIRISWPAPRTI